MNPHDLAEIVDGLQQEIRDASNRIVKAILISGITQTHPEQNPNDIFADVEFFMQRIGR